MKKTSKKTVRRVDNKSISFRLTEDEMATVRIHLGVESAGRPPVSMAAYAKHALLDHRRLRAMEKHVRNLKQEIGDGKDSNGDWIAGELVLALNLTGAAS